MIHAVTKKEIPVICPKTDCSKKKCLIRYMFESKYCESYEKIEQKATELQRQLLQQDMSDGEWFEQQERLIALERQSEVLRITKM